MQTPIPLDFVFTQNNLQSYLDCPRQFEFRYLLKQKCPSLIAKARIVDQFAQLGTIFHEILQRYLIGLPIDSFISQADPQIQQWWNTFKLHNPIPDNSSMTAPEVTYACTVEHARVMVKLDLLVVSTGGEVLIFDWKTSTKPPSINIIKKRIQTRLYPYVVSKVSRIGGHEFTPDHVKMTYWFCNFPAQPTEFQYSSAQFHRDEAFLLKLIQEIRETPLGGYSLTRDKRFCAFCNYFLLCHKNSKPIIDTAELEEDILPVTATNQEDELGFRSD